MSSTIAAQKQGFELRVPRCQKRRIGRCRSGFFAENFLGGAHMHQLGIHVLVGRGNLSQYYC